MSPRLHGVIRGGRNPSPDSPLPPVTSLQLLHCAGHNISIDMRLHILSGYFVLSIFIMAAHAYAMEAIMSGHGSVQARTPSSVLTGHHTELNQTLPRVGK